MVRNQRWLTIQIIGKSFLHILVTSVVTKGHLLALVRVMGESPHNTYLLIKFAYHPMQASQSEAGGCVVMGDSITVSTALGKSWNHIVPVYLDGLSLSMSVRQECLG